MLPFQLIWWRTSTNLAYHMHKGDRKTPIIFHKYGTDTYQDGKKVTSLPYQIVWVGLGLGDSVGRGPLSLACILVNAAKCCNDQSMRKTNDEHRSATRYTYINKNGTRNISWNPQLVFVSRNYSVPSCSSRGMMSLINSPESREREHLCKAQCFSILHLVQWDMGCFRIWNLHC